MVQYNHIQSLKIVVNKIEGEVAQIYTNKNQA